MSAARNMCMRIFDRGSQDLPAVQSPDRSGSALLAMALSPSSTSNAERWLTRRSVHALIHKSIDIAPYAWHSSSQGPTLYDNVSRLLHVNIGAGASPTLDFVARGCNQSNGACHPEERNPYAQDRHPSTLPMVLVRPS